MTTTLREGCDGVCQGVDLCEDCVVRVGRDADLVAGEIHVVNLAVRVVAPECCFPDVCNKRVLESVF